MNYKKNEYHKKAKLYIQQAWLIDKKDQLDYLLSSCKTEESKDLIYTLLERFIYLTPDNLKYLLDLTIVTIEKSGFIPNTSQIVALAYDDQPDSSQRVIDHLKMPLYQNENWKRVKLVNRFGKCISHINKKGLNQIIFIDEFIGSGKTIISRITDLKKKLEKDIEFIVIYLAGIEDAIQYVESQGINIFCHLQIKKGISGYYYGYDLEDKKNIMYNLEKKLAPTINDKMLSEYSFGYGEAEALFSAEGCFANTPNSTFPIFWWSKDFDDKTRPTLLTRYEEALL